MCVFTANPRLTICCLQYLSTLLELFKCYEQPTSPGLYTSEYDARIRCYAPGQWMALLPTAIVGLFLATIGTSTDAPVSTLGPDMYVRALYSVSAHGGRHYVERPVANVQRRFLRGRPRLHRPHELYVIGD